MVFLVLGIAKQCAGFPGDQFHWYQANFPDSPGFSGKIPTP
jgi:hypothetical protein